jgi:hypothetical protein
MSGTAVWGVDGLDFMSFLVRMCDGETDQWNMCARQSRRQRMGTG